MPAMDKKKVIGLTGTYCAGKNHIAAILEAHGLPVLDLDKLGHLVLETEKKTLVDRFGEGILGSGATVDRKLLGEKVFGSREKLNALEEIIHPGVNRETLSWINARKEKYCVINAALLHRSSAFDLLDAIIIVEAPLIIRLIRAKKRDHLGWRALINRFRSQNDFHSQYFKGKTDIYRVENSGFFCTKNQKKTENRIIDILSNLGIK